MIRSTLRTMSNLRQKYQGRESVEAIASLFEASGDSDTLSLDLGCGSKPRNPFNASELYGCDAFVAEGFQDHIKQTNLAIDEIPFNSDMFDFCTAFDFIEHVPRVLYVDGKMINPFVQLMNKIFRVLKNGGIFMSVTPAFPSLQVFQDPTHNNVITEDTFPIYFTGSDAQAEVLGYGFNGRFRLICQYWVGFRLVTLLRADKAPFPIK